MSWRDWWDPSVDGSIPNGILWPGDDNSWWNKPLGQAVDEAVEAVSGAVSGTTEAVSNTLKDGGLPNDRTLNQKEYEFGYKMFPTDLGMSYAGHYMIININVPITLTSARTPGSRPIADTNITPLQFSMLEDELSKVDVLRFKTVASGNESQSDSITSRRTRRIKESIALYMPGTQLVYNGMNSYEEISMTALAGQLAVGAISGVAGLATYFVGGLVGAPLSGLGSAASSVASATSNVLDAAGNAVTTAAKLAGRPINPRIEVLFAQTSLRDFQFEFLFMPRNEEEAQAVRGIINTIRFHAAPELGAYGTYFIPPAEFDITFFHNGKENKNIQRINTCVLTRCEVDYAPGTGMFSTYKDGMPVATRMMLVFREVEPVHKLRILQGF